MRASKKITNIHEFNDSLSLGEVHHLKKMLDDVSVMIINSEEAHLIELNQTIEKDVFTVMNKKGYHVIAAFSKSAVMWDYKNRIAHLHVDLCLDPRKPILVYDDIDNYSLDKAIKTINHEKFRLT